MLEYIGYFGMFYLGLICGFFLFPYAAMTLFEDMNDALPEK